MRVAQIIDSLEPGGAERIAVNYANALAEKIEFSALIATRDEGDLKLQLDHNVHYLFLKRQRTIDFPAVFRLRRFCKSNNIAFLHAHSSSFAIAVLVKLTLPKIKIIWHDHDGLSDFLHQRKTLVLRMASFFFASVISVNVKLENWAKDKLNCKNVIYLPNFTEQNYPENKQTRLKGHDGKRILCLANLRAQKNHFFLIEIALAMRKKFPDWSFHLVGKDFQDDYSKEIKNSIRSKELEDYVYIYGSRNDINNIIAQAEIGILTSSSEGLPVSLLEYGFNQKPVVVTNVGEIPSIINHGENGFLAQSNDTRGFCVSLEKLLINKELRSKMGDAFYSDTEQKYSKRIIISKYLNWLQITQDAI
jgi:glycosyltransferase involved in cell wall biosynthesis